MAYFIHGNHEMNQNGVNPAGGAAEPFINSNGSYLHTFGVPRNPLAGHRFSHWAEIWQKEFIWRSMPVRFTVESWIEWAFREFLYWKVSVMYAIKSDIYSGFRSDGLQLPPKRLPWILNTFQCAIIQPLLAPVTFVISENGATGWHHFRMISPAQKRFSPVVVTSKQFESQWKA
jgi:hypothetical protein